MKQWEYSKPWKLTALLLNQICAVVLVLSVVVYGLCGRQRLWLRGKGSDL